MVCELQFSRPISLLHGALLGTGITWTVNMQRRVVLGFLITICPNKNFLRQGWGLC